MVLANCGGLRTNLWSERVIRSLIKEVRSRSTCSGRTQRIAAFCAIMWWRRSDRPVTACPSRCLVDFDIAGSRGKRMSIRQRECFTKPRLITTIVAGLGLAFLFGPIAQRLRASPLVGCLLAGVAVGPFTPGFLADPALATELAEIGVRTAPIAGPRPHPYSDTLLKFLLEAKRPAVYRARNISVMGAGRRRRRARSPVEGTGITTTAGDATLNGHAGLFGPCRDAPTG